MRAHTGALTVDVVRADVVDADRVDLVVSLMATHDVVVDRGEVELVRALALTHRERNWNGASSIVSRRTESVLGRVDLEAPGPLAAGQTEHLHVVVPVPTGGEASIAGRLVQQQYAVRVQFRTGERQVRATKDVHVPSTPDPSLFEPPSAVRDDAGTAVLGIEDVPPRLYGGVPVRGTVTLDPLVGGHARAVRVDLLMVEHVSASPGEPLQEDLDASSVISSVTPAEHVELVPGQALRLTFTLHAPDRLPAPTVRTPDFAVRWVLQAALDRPLRRDPRVTLELLAATD
ncbi:hypothetical protein SAMN05660350_04476 [Geodermatophilus obscurus]|uniref:Arrestin-like N-terminal domain-containing protein n=1 Tax=Geodermatophilus obscurus TaxID=1861 RepID=A0A1M7UZ97_9ACTN|nr:hypothetical protein [Geodermatophilus obscurus]SHN88361.1 hypothetical protein SAMN05660350_04476 [Geodermatophilus obscurus]